MKTGCAACTSNALNMRQSAWSTYKMCVLSAIVSQTAKTPPQRLNFGRHHLLKSFCLCKWDRLYLYGNVINGFGVLCNQYCRLRLTHLDIEALWLWVRRAQANRVSSTLCWHSFFFCLRQRPNIVLDTKDGLTYIPNGQNSPVTAEIALKEFLGSTNKNSYLVLLNSTMRSRPIAVLVLSISFKSLPLKTVVELNRSRCKIGVVYMRYISNKGTNNYYIAWTSKLSMCNANTISKMNSRNLASCGILLAGCGLRLQKMLRLL